ncbi:MAG: cation:proton antiporter regulatory subunit [Anaerobacillus sp.]|uniref:cation:proton antiporter regulatory subunit n=1 Tax=Anaerobacillus sp. TaxID=1872506 RepID=UPI003919707C
MKTIVTDLPTVGKKITMVTSKNEKINLITHHTGKRDLYFSHDVDDDEADYAIELSAQDTRELGAQLLGASYQPGDSDQMKMVKGAMVLEWYTLTASSALVGKTLVESDIRAKTGAMVVAITRGENVIVSPAADEVLKTDDVLMVAGSKENIFSFEEWIKTQYINSNNRGV